LKSTATKSAIPTGFLCKYPVEKDVGNGQGYKLLERFSKTSG
jgi:hypothetical protein